MLEDLFDVSAEGACVLRVHVQPGAGRTAVVGRHGDALKLKVAAPPEQGRANEACAALLAEVLGVAPASIALAGGGASRSKRFSVEGIAPEEMSQRLERALDEAGASSGAGSRGRRQGGPRRR